MTEEDKKAVEALELAAVYVAKAYPFWIEGDYRESMERADQFLGRITGEVTGCHYDEHSKDPRLVAAAAKLRKTASKLFDWVEVQYGHPSEESDALEPFWTAMNELADELDPLEEKQDAT